MPDPHGLECPAHTLPHPYVTRQSKCDATFGQEQKRHAMSAHMLVNAMTAPTIYKSGSNLPRITIPRIWNVIAGEVLHPFWQVAFLLFEFVMNHHHTEFAWIALSDHFLTAVLKSGS